MWGQLEWVLFLGSFAILWRAWYESQADTEAILREYKGYKEEDSEVDKSTQTSPVHSDILDDLLREFE